MAAEQLDLDDLDAEDLKALAEVSKKGYYHARPKSEAAPAPRRLDVVDSSAATPCTTGKREDFDEFQRKWDRFDRSEPDIQEGSSSGASRINTRPAAAPSPSPQQLPIQADEAIVAQLVGMGFDEMQSRQAAIATGNRADAAVELILGGGGSISGRAGSGPAVATQQVRPTEPAKADEEKLAMLLEMGFPESHARAALQACNNDLERAIEQAASRADESQNRLERARSSLTELEADVAAAEVAAGAPDKKRLRYLEENLTQASCNLDSVEVHTEDLRAKRRVELDRCNALDSRLVQLRQKAATVETEAAPETSSASAEATTPGPEATEAASASAPAASAGAAEDADEAAASGTQVAESAAEDTDTAAVDASAAIRIAEAERLRLVGNTAFKAEDFNEAVKNYLGALSLDRENVAILSNLAAAELKLGEFEAAAAHAGEANMLSGGFSAKALFRQGQALEGMGQFVEACSAFRAAIQIEPTDRLMRQRLEDCQKHAATVAAAAAQSAASVEGVAPDQSNIEGAADPVVETAGPAADTDK